MLRAVGRAPEKNDRCSTPDRISCDDSRQGSTELVVLHAGQFLSFYNCPDMPDTANFNIKTFHPQTSARASRPSIMDRYA